MPERDDVALAVAAAEWVGWEPLAGGGWDRPIGANVTNPVAQDDHELLDMEWGGARLLVALMAECHAEGIRVQVEVASGRRFARAWERDGFRDHFRSDDAGPLVPLLRALDAAGVLPEAGGGA